jgi:hypothetical protein
MPAACPFCGTTLNFGLKFCVVCGRHTTSNEMTKMGGLKSGIKQGESTRRLDESISSSDFETSRKKPLRLARHLKSIGEQLFYVLIGVTLLFCAFRFALQTWFPGKVHQLLAPILGKNSDIIEQSLTGTPAQVADAGSASDDSKTSKDDAKAQKQTAKQGKQNKSKQKQKKTAQQKTMPVTANRGAQVKTVATAQTPQTKLSTPKTTPTKIVQARTSQTGRAAGTAQSSSTTATTTKKTSHSRRRRRWRRRAKSQQKSSTQTQAQTHQK